MAGRGKSTIASTVEKRWRDRATCAIFHFRRDDSSLDTRLICSLAKQLSRGLDLELRDAILDSVRKDDIATKRLNEQFDALLLGPLKFPRNTPAPILIIIDALDECGSTNTAVAFVKLLKRNLLAFPDNVKFLLTSRPELPLTKELDPVEWPKESLDADHVYPDIDLYLTHGFSEIRQKESLPEEWPSRADVANLVRMSQGLFQWARTILKYVDDGLPQRRLKEVLESPEQWGEVDALYTQILSSALGRLKKHQEIGYWLYHVMN